MATNFPPALIFILGALIIPLIPAKTRSSWVVALAVTCLAVIINLPIGQSVTYPFLSYELIVLQVDKLSWIFGLIFGIVGLIGGVYGFHKEHAGEWVGALLYAGGALGVTFAGDYFTLLVFWELMAIASAVLIFRGTFAGAQCAGLRYLYFHLLGGSLLLAGIILHINEGSALAMEALTDTTSLSNWLILLGVMINAAIPPLHAWLPDSYPRASVTGAVFLSAFTTKSAVYVLLRLFPGWDVLLYLGVIMTLYGVIYAVLSNDIRGILAYHIISQVGYMVAGAGIGTELGVNGATAHAFSHILYKGVLFMGTGMVIYSTSRSKLTELGGLYKGMWLTFWFYMIGAFSISGFPLFNGFISKSMVVSAAGEAGHRGAYFLLLLASVGTFLSVGLKLPYFTWFGEANGSTEPERKLPRNMFIGISIGGGLCFFFGVVPQVLYNWLPYATDFHPYNLYHFVESVQILLFTFLASVFLRKKLKGEDKLSLDTDFFYRKPAAWFQRITVDSVNRGFSFAEKLSRVTVERVVTLSQNPMRLISFKKDRREEFNPDVYRAPLARAVSAFLLVFVALALWAL